MAEVIVTPPGTLSFCDSLFKAKPPAQGAEPRFSAVLVFDAKAQASDEYKALKIAIAECAKAEWGDKVNLAGLRMPIRKGEEKEHLSGFGAGKVFISAWTKNKPGVIDMAGNELIDPSLVWAGQEAKFSLQPFAYENSGNKGVSLGLRHVLVTAMDRPRIDGRGNAAGDFANVEGFSSKGGSSASTADADDLPF